MVAPCDKYQGLVVGPDGQTVADPYGMIPTLGDYEEWRGVALALIERAERELDRERELGLTPTVDSLASVQLQRQTWESMGGALWQSLQEFNLTWGASIRAMVAIAQGAACNIGIIEARIVAGGGNVADDIPTPPDPPAGKGSKTGGLGVGLLAVAALFLFTRD